MTAFENFTEDLMSSICNSEFDIDCPTCGKELTVTISNVGESVNCPHCGEIINLATE